MPVRYAHYEMVVKGYIDRIMVCRGDERIAEHPRLWGKVGVHVDPVHYLALLERKARQLEDWQLPSCFRDLRNRLEAGLDGEGTREFIKVLRLLEKHSLKELVWAVEPAVTFHLLLRSREGYNNRFMRFKNGESYE